MRATDVIYAHGHRLVKAEHRTTFEITRDEFLTEQGDCIIALGADKAAADLHVDFKRVARMEDAEITIIIEADGLSEVVKAKGDPRLSFIDSNSMVVRRSMYICGRTIAVKADKAAADLSRSLIERIKDPSQKIKITLIATV